MAHERSDVSAGKVFVCALALIALAGLTEFGFHRWFFSVRPRGLWQASAPRDLPPPPRLQANPRADLETYLSRERALIHGYGWVDREKRVARIPVERAMDLLLETPSGRAPSSLDPAKSVGFTQNLGARLPLDTRFTTEHGEPLEFGQLLGDRPTILAFAYYHCPNLCTLVLNGLANVLKQTSLKPGRDFRIVTVSIDPTERAPTALAKERGYLARLGLTENTAPDAWRFLTGTEPEIRRLAEAAGFRYEKDPISGEYAHPSGFLVVTPRGKISQYFFGIQFDAPALTRALSVARANRPGSWAEEILLNCFHYDPLAHPGNAWILDLIRGLAALGSGAVIALIAYLTISDRRRKREFAS